jgi:site-specific recombinase XerD
MLRNADMALFRRGIDLAIIALWFGHEFTETTEVYMHVDIKNNARALANATYPASTLIIIALRIACSLS